MIEPSGFSLTDREQMASEAEECAHALLRAAAAMRADDSNAASRWMGEANGFMCAQATMQYEIGLPVGYVLILPDGSERSVNIEDIVRQRMGFHSGAIQ